VQTTIKSFIIGFTAIYIGRMQKIDPQIQQLSKIADWRNEHGTKGDFVLDARVGYNYKDKLTATIIAKNFTNHAYTLRPGFIEAPANYTLQVTYQFGKIFPLKKKVAEDDSNASM
jgi:outer membrane receptor protein involved in Fe transport